VCKFLGHSPSRRFISAITYTLHVRAHCSIGIPIPDPIDPLKLSGSPMIRSIGSGIRSGQYFSTLPRSNPTCFFRCKSRDHLSFYRRSDQKGDRIVIAQYPIYSRTILSHPREEHVGGSHPYKKNKNKCFLGVDYIL